MSTPTATLETALRQLDLAYGKLTLPDWQAHAEALADAVAGLTDLLLHVDADTGAYHPEPIYRDPKRSVLGMLPEVVAPLVRLLQRQTKQLDEALERGWLMPPNEAPAWIHWHLRLARYVASTSLAVQTPETPSETLWREVTAPLLQGIYPSEFASLGIVNPDVPSAPDVATVPTTAFMVALQTQELSRVQTWLLSWREGLAAWLEETRAAIRARFMALEARVRSGGRRVVGVLAVVGVLGGLGVVGWHMARASSDKRKGLQETSG